MEENKKKFDVFSWLKPLVISIIGTSIGVGLSFTVNRLVESHKQQKAQRETAIMAVYDIDEINRQIKEEEELEDSLFKITTYAFTHQEDLETMSEDTLHMVIAYLFYNPSEIKGWAADTRENAFNSGIDVRRNLANTQFYDNVQSCYQVRRELKKYMDNAQAFRQPLTSEDYEQFMSQLPAHETDVDATWPVPEATARLLRQAFQKQSTALYLKRYFKRHEAYNSTYRVLERLNRENKYLMNISDEDMEAYVRQNVDRSLSATNALIEGTWELSRGEELATYIFRADSTIEFTCKGVNHLQLMLREENMEVAVNIPFTSYMQGKWTLKGDSLAVVFNKEKTKYLSLDIDFSNLPKAALERAKDSLEIKKKPIKDYFLQHLKNLDSDFTNQVKFDISGNTMIWNYGGKRIITEHLFRKKE